MARFPIVKMKKITVGLLIAFLLFPVIYLRAQTVGQLVKGSLPAVYYITGNAKRLAFSDEATYFSWYPDFSQVQTLPDDQLAAIPFVGLVTIRPGAVIVKTAIDPKVYAVARGGVLRWVNNEDTAKLIYGVDWASKVYVIPEEFLTAYKFGDDITAGGQYWWQKELDASPTIDADYSAGSAADAAKPAMPVVAAKKNVLFVLWDPKRPQHPAPDKTVLERVLYGAAPSAIDYYRNESGGNAVLVNAGVLGWYAADKPPEHYWSDEEISHQGDGYKTGAAERLGEALRRADDDFDFSKYDANGDRKITADELSIFIVIPQLGDPQNVIATPYSAEDPTAVPLVADGVTIGAVDQLYIGTPLGSDSEFGAILFGFAKQAFDLSELSSTNGSFSLMSDHASGLRLDPYNRIKIGAKIDLIPKVAEVSQQNLGSNISGGGIIRIDRDQPDGPGLGTEYFLIENREHGVYDGALPDIGIAIWDVNGSNVSLKRLDSATPLNDTRALWRRDNGASLPTALELSWASDNARSGVRLLNVTDAGAVMDFTLEKKILNEFDVRPLPSPIQ